MTESDFLTLIYRHRSTIDRICWMHRRHSKQDREDLFQEILLKAWKSRDTFEGRCPFEAWLYKVARNTALASYRKKGIAICGRYVPAEIPDESGLTEEPEVQLSDAIKRLSSYDQKLISLYLDDRSYREMSEMTGKSENNIAVRLNRIRVRIQKLLKLR